MKSVRCIACGFTTWADQETCKKCGAALFDLTDNQHRRPAPRSKKGLAITSLVIGIVNFLSCNLLGLAAIAGLSFGIISLVKAGKRPHVFGGKGLALAGVVMNGLAVLFLPITIAIAIPNFIAARRAANEGSAISSLRSLAAAEDTYYRVHLRYGAIVDLRDDHLITSEMAATTRNGYKFDIKPSGPNYLHSEPTFDAFAIPVEYGNSGRRSFMIDETGVVRVADIHGREASRSARSLDDGGTFGDD